MDNYSDLQQPLIEIIEQANQAILAVYSTQFDVRHKIDASPVTEADHRAHDVILEGLNRLEPNIPVISEESPVPSLEERSTWDQYWLVDPLDGTKEFVKRSGEFTVNIALVKQHHPVLGIASVPVTDEIYFGDVTEQTAKRIANGEESTIQIRSITHNHVVAMQSRRRRSIQADRFLAAIQKELGTVHRETSGSSLKCLRVAEGEADLYLQTGPTSEWDTAAVHAILKAAGGDIFSFGAQSLTYNHTTSLINPPFLAIGDLDSTSLNYFHEKFDQYVG